MTRLLRAALAASLLFAAPAAAQKVAPPDGATAQPAGEQVIQHQRLEDILARQSGEGEARLPRDDSARGAAAQISAQLGARGGLSRSDIWEEVRFGAPDMKASARGAASTTLMQDGGMWWLDVRAGPLKTYGGWLLIGTLIALALFYLIRGRIRISQGLSSVKVLRFTAIERFAHWLMGGAFIVLGVTGLISLFGRIGLIPWMGHEAYAVIAAGSKWVHNNISWAFILGMILAFFCWVVHNLPDRTDFKWLAKGGGIFGSEHPPAKKFNAGQKFIFWSVMVLGGSIAATGLALLFPFELYMFAGTFATLNDLGLPQLVGLDPLPIALSPQEEMQYAQLWHAIVSFVLMAIILAHIYIGSVGMEGAYDAMGSGEVDLNWAEDHHSLWVEKLREDDRRIVRKGVQTPAE